MMYNLCPDCGASLDPNETCDCTKEKEPSRGNVIGSDGIRLPKDTACIIQHNDLAVKHENEALRALREHVGMTQKEMTAYIRKIAPLFNIVFEMGCEQSTETGVQLRTDIMDMLIIDLAPEFLDHAKWIRNGRHKLSKQLGARVPAIIHEKVTQYSKADGITVQELFSKFAYDYVKDWEARHNE